MVKKEKASSNLLLNKINLRTILRSKLQFLAIILITAIAMTLFVGLTSNAKSINDRVNSLYKDANMADLWVNTTGGTNDLNDLKALIKDDGVIEERFMLPAKLQAKEATAIMLDKLPTINKAVNTDNKDEENFFIVDSRLTESTSAFKGNFLDDKGNYLTIPVKFSISQVLEVMAKTKLPGSDKNLLETLEGYKKEDKESLFNNPYLTLNLEVTGSMQFAENILSSEMNNNSNFLLSKNYFIETATNLIKDTYDLPKLYESLIPTLLTSITTPNNYVLKLNKNVSIKETQNKIIDYYEAKDKNNLIICNDLANLASNLPVSSDISQAHKLSYIFPVIFFLVAILVVLTTISQIILKDRIQIGTMKALGFSTSRIIFHYMTLSVYIVLIGILMGIIIGPFIVPLIMEQKYNILYSLPKMHYTLAIPEMLISTLLVILITALVTFSVVYKEAKEMPSEAMRPKEVKVVKESKKELKITKNTLPIKMALRNIKLNFAKSLMVVIGIAGCTGLLVCGFGIDDTLDHGVKSDESHFFNADLYANYNSNDSKYADLSKIEGVTEVLEYTQLPVSISSNGKTYQSFVTVLPEDNTFMNFDNYKLQDKVIITNKVSKELNLKVGDKINFSSIGLNFEGEVGYIVDVFFKHGIYLNGSLEKYEKLTNIKTHAFIRADKEAIKDVKLASEKVSGITSVQTHEENIDLVNSYMSSLHLMTLAVKVFAILLAMVVLYNLSLLNFKERTRDIATLKVLGFNKQEIGASLFFESLILTLVGVIFGLFLGKPLEILVLIVNLTPIVEFLYKVYPLSYLFSFLLTVLTTVIVNFFLVGKIKKVQMVESLKSVE